MPVKQAVTSISAHVFSYLEESTPSTIRTSKKFNLLTVLLESETKFSDAPIILAHIQAHIYSRLRQELPQTKKTEQKATQHKSSNTISDLDHKIALNLQQRLKITTKIDAEHLRRFDQFMQDYPLLTIDSKSQALSSATVPSFNTIPTLAPTLSNTVDDNSTQLYVDPAREYETSKGRYSPRNQEAKNFAKIQRSYPLEALTSYLNQSGDGADSYNPLSPEFNSQQKNSSVTKTQARLPAHYSIRARLAIERKTSTTPKCKNPWKPYTGSLEPMLGIIRSCRSISNSPKSSGNTPNTPNTPVSSTSATFDSTASTPRNTQLEPLPYIKAIEAYTKGKIHEASKIIHASQEKSPEKLLESLEMSTFKPEHSANLTEFSISSPTVIESPSTLRLSDRFLTSPTSATPDSTQPENNNSDFKNDGDKTPNSSQQSPLKTACKKLINAFCDDKNATSNDKFRLMQSLKNHWSDNFNDAQIESFLRKFLYLALQRRHYTLTTTTRSGLKIRTLLNSKGFAPIKQFMQSRETEANECTESTRRYRYRDMRLFVIGTEKEHGQFSRWRKQQNFNLIKSHLGKDKKIASQIRFKG